MELSRAYCLKNPIEDFTIRIKLQKSQNILKLPSFETRDNQSIFEEPIEHTFKWQQKLFSSYELQIYADAFNCTNDTTKKYHEAIENGNIQSAAPFFTQLNDDYFVNEPLLNSGRPTNIKKKGFVNKINKWLGGIVNNSDTELFGCHDNDYNIDDWFVMRILIDLRMPSDDNPILLERNELTLLTINYNKSKNVIILRPDLNDFHWNPYKLNTPSDVYLYSVELEHKGSALNQLAERKNFMKRLHSKLNRRIESTINFILPEEEKTSYFVTLELLSAQEFDDNDIYVEFQISLPNYCNCSSELSGRTHVTESLENVFNFSHLIEFCFDIGESVEELFPKAKVYFEVISIDWWGRHRTEGYGYTVIDLNITGRLSNTVKCMRPEFPDSLSEDSRRFFIGGYHLLDDISVIGTTDISERTKINKFGMKFKPTGTLQVSTQVVKQSQRRVEIDDISSCLTEMKISSRDTFTIENTNNHNLIHSSQGLLKSIDHVLKEYKKARDRISQCTSDDVIE